MSERETWGLICNAAERLIRTLTTYTSAGPRVALSRQSLPTHLSLAFAVLLRYSLRLDQDQELLRALQHSQLPSRSGHFCDPALEEDERLSVTHVAYLQRQTDYFSSLALLANGWSVAPFAFTDQVLALDPSDWVRSLDWTNPWDCGNELLFNLHALQLCPTDQRSAAKAWVQQVLTCLESLQDEVTGWWPAGLGSTLHLSAMCGAVHVYPFFMSVGTPVPKSERIIANTLALQNEDGSFYPIPGGGACPDYDAVATLWWLGRGELSRPALEKANLALMANIDAEGQFCEARRPDGPVRLPAVLDDRLLPWFLNRNHMYSGWHRMTYEVGEPTLWAQWFRSLTLGMVQIALGRSTRVKFLRVPGLGWAPAFEYCQ